MSDVKISLLSQILSLVDRDIFNKIVRKHNSDKFSKGINTWTHMVSMVFMQLSGSSSIRDIANGLLSATGNLSHLGIYKSPSKSSISYLNQTRSYEVFQDLYFELLRKLEPRLEKARQYAHKLKRQIFIVDSSIIPLSLSLFGQNSEQPKELLSFMRYWIMIQACPIMQSFQMARSMMLKWLKA